MEASGVDAIVTWAPVSVRYLTGYWCWIAPLLKQYMVAPGGDAGLAMRNIAVLPRRNDPTLVVDMLWALNTVDAGVTDIRVVGDAAMRMADDGRELSAELKRVFELITQADRPRDPVEALVATLREQGLEGSRLGVELKAQVLFISQRLLSLSANRFGVSHPDEQQDRGTTIYDAQRDA